MNLSESPFSGLTVRPRTGALGTVSSFIAACPPTPAWAGVLAGLVVGSTGVRRFRVQVSGHSGTCDGGRREGGEVECGVGVPVHHQVAVLTVVHPGVQWQFGFHRAAVRAGLGGGKPSAGGVTATTSSSPI